MAKKINALGIEIDYKEYWKKRKAKKLWCRMQLNYDRTKELLSAGQFTIEELCRILFESDKKSDLALLIINHIKKSEKPVFFKDMVLELKISRSTAWQVYLSLKRAGIISRKTKAEPLILSNGFANVLEDLELWWKNFVRVK